MISQEAADTFLSSIMNEALLIKPGFATPDNGSQSSRAQRSTDLQRAFVMEKRAAYRA